ncbi:MAG: hypothetical protein QME07_05685 [bacterium]|nr:hypothetical protein [bacterium]
MMENILTPIERVESIRKTESDDLFLTASSFEMRSRRVPVLVDAPAFENSIIFQYQDTLDTFEGLVNTDFINSRLKKASCKKPSILQCNYKDAYGLLEEFQSWIEEKEFVLNEKCVTIDITCFTKLHLLLLLKYLRERGRNNQIRILYTEPLIYASMMGRNLSHGTLKPFYIPLLSNRNGKDKEALLLFLGHEFLRAYHIWHETEPEEIFLLTGEPGFTSEMAEKSRRVNKELINMVNHDESFSKRECSTTNFVQVKDVLKGIIDELSKKGFGVFYIAPLGTKLQALGIDLLTQELKEGKVIIAYPPPRRYEKSCFSEGAGKTFSALLTPPKSLPIDSVSKTATKAELPSWLLREKEVFLRLQSQGKIETKKKFVVIKDGNVLGYGDEIDEILQRFQGKYPYLLEETEREEDVMLSPFVLGIGVK